MNMILRLLRIFLPGLFAGGRADYSQPAAINFITSRKDVCTDGQLRSHRATSYVDLSVMNYLGRVGLLKAGRKDGWLPLVASRSVALYARPDIGQKISVFTRMMGWDATHICLEHAFRQTGGGLIAVAHTVAIVRRGKERVTSREMFLAIKGDPDTPSPPLPQHILEMIRTHEMARALTSLSLP